MGYDQNIERDWKTMIKISHDFFHCWRKAVLEKYGEKEAEQLVLRFWELVGDNTAKSYLKAKIDTNDPKKVALAAARSSQIMGENVHVEEKGEAYLLVHDDCPWIGSYRAAGAPGKCQPGCDRWFEATVSALSPNLGLENQSSLANGAEKCVRRFFKK